MSTQDESRPRRKGRRRRSLRVPVNEVPLPTELRPVDDVDDGSVRPAFVDDISSMALTVDAEPENLDDLPRSFDSAPTLIEPIVETPRDAESAMDSLTRALVRAEEALSGETPLALDMELSEDSELPAPAYEETGDAVRLELEPAGPEPATATRAELHPSGRDSNEVRIDLSRPPPPPSGVVMRSEPKGRESVPGEAPPSLPASAEVRRGPPASRQTLPGEPPPSPAQSRESHEALPASKRLATPPPGSVAPSVGAMARPRRRWWEKLFNDDYLRTVPIPHPRDIARQCDFIERRLGLARGAALLDVGCGLGLHAVELTRRGYLVVGLDLSLPMLSRAADEAQEHGFKINFLHGDMRDMKFEGAFDAVLCWGTTFGYFDDDTNRGVVERLYQALKPRGLLLLDVVNRDFVVRTQPNLVWFEGDGCVVMEETQCNFISSRLYVKRTVILDDGRQRESTYSIRLYSLHELGQILHHQGFRVVEVSGHEAHPGVFFGSDSPRLLVLAERRVPTQSDKAYGQERQSLEPRSATVELVAEPATAGGGPDDLAGGDLAGGDLAGGDLDPGDLDPGDLDPGDLDPGDLEVEQPERARSRGDQSAHMLDTHPGTPIDMAESDVIDPDLVDDPDAIDPDAIDLDAINPDVVDPDVADDEGDDATSEDRE